jgi:hypothetical protein
MDGLTDGLQCGLDWVGLGWIGLDWVGLGWIGLDWVGLGWIDGRIDGHKNGHRRRSSSHIRNHSSRGASMLGVGVAGAPRGM